MYKAESLGNLSSSLDKGEVLVSDDIEWRIIADDVNIFDYTPYVWQC
jgi:hypothetical protein